MRSFNTTSTSMWGISLINCCHQGYSECQTLFHGTAEQVWRYLKDQVMGTYSRSFDIVRATLQSPVYDAVVSLSLRNNGLRTEAYCEVSYLLDSYRYTTEADSVNEIEMPRLPLYV